MLDKIIHTEHSVNKTILQMSMNMNNDRLDSMELCWRALGGVPQPLFRESHAFCFIFSNFYRRHNKNSLTLPYATTNKISLKSL
jgi:hypothetical protein